MTSTLAERLIAAMSGPPKVTSVALSMACGVTPPSVHGWRTGKSKTLEGSNLLAAAKFLGVRSEWLANGIGSKYPSEPVQGEMLLARAPVAGYIKPKQHDGWTLEAIDILQKLNKTDRRAAVLGLRAFVHTLGPPRHGQTLPVAVKNEGFA